MKKRSINWEDLLTLATLVKAVTYSAAARELGITHATVARRMRRLEDAVGVSVLHRRDDGLHLTDEGRTALAAADEMERSADQLLRSLASGPGGVSGRVRITTTELLGSCFFIPRLASVYERHPALSVEFLLENKTLSLSRRKADLAIRLARPEQEGLVAKRLGVMGYGIYLSRRHPQFAQYARSLQGSIPLCTLDGVDTSLANLPEGLWLKNNLPDARRIFSTNSPLGLYHAVRSGWGAGLLPCYLAHGDEQLGALVMAPVVHRDLWLVYPREYRNVQRFRVVIDHIVSIVESESDLLSGGIV